jgi:CRISPR-associated protein Cas2
MVMSRRALNNNRRLYLCTYDMADDKRRNRVFELLKDHGEHVQYSVFLCELTAPEHARLIASSRILVNEATDQLLILDIGPPGLDWTQQLSCIGKHWTPLIRTTIV